MAHTFDTKVKIPAAANATTAANPSTGTFTCGVDTTLLTLGLIHATATDRGGGAPTYNNIAMTKADINRSAPVSPEAEAELWYLLDPPTNQPLLISVPNSGGLAMAIFVSSYKAQAGYTSVLDVAAGTGSTSANPSVRLVTTANGDAIIGVVAHGANAWLPTRQSGTVIYNTDPSTWGGGAQYILQPTAGVVLFNWTQASDDYGAIAAAFKESLLLILKTVPDIGTGTEELILSTALPNNPPLDITSKYSIINNTLTRVMKNNVEDKLDIEIGDITNINSFRPKFKIKRWDDEVNFSLHFDVATPGKEDVLYKGEKIVWAKNNYRVIFYDKPDASDKGGFEFEIEIPNKPSVNSLVLPITTKGLKFYKQPPLPQYLLDRGWYMPENVINSYAVYHDTKKDYIEGQKNYGTGKAFHIYRPKVTDNLGTWVWIDIDIDALAGTLTLTIPQSFLDAAIYPIVIDPTFGYETAGSFAGNTENLYVTGGGTPTEAGTVSKLTARLESTSGSKNYKGGIHNNSLAKLTNGETSVVSVSTVNWYDLPFPVQPSVTASNFYYLGILSEAGVGNGNIYIDNAGDYGYGETASTYPTIPDPINDFSIFFFVSVYATYGSAAVTKTVTDTGVGTDAKPTLSASLSRLDTGAGSDKTSLSASLTTTEIGSGTERPSLSASLTQRETGSGLDITSPPSASLSLSEISTITETLAQLASLGLIDVGAGIDSSTLAASLGLIDGGLSTDFLNLSALNYIYELGRGNDTLAELLASLGIAEGGSGGDMLSLLASLSLDDVGSGSDDISILTALFKTIQDTASGIDGVSISASLSVIDLGNGQDGLSIQVTLSISDEGLGTDDVSISKLVANLIQILDLAAGMDGVSISASLNLPELGYGIDAQSIAAQLTNYDVSINNDGLTIQASLSITDTSAATDAISILAATIKIVQDLASGNDFVGQISASLSLDDTGIGTDALGQLLAYLMVTDIGTGVEVVVKYDLTLRIVKISFIINKKAITFAELQSHRIGFSLQTREIDFSLVSGG